LLGTGLLLVAGFALSACSTSRTTGSLADASGKHPSSFVDAHPSYARPDGAACTECHGDDLRGGISKVSCFSASLNGVACHPAGPAFHPSDWLNKTSANFHGTAFTNNVLVRDLPCSACHDPGDPALYICLDCHFTQEGRRVPQGSTYTHGQIPGHTTFGPLDALNDNTSVCVRCHETNNLFGHMPQPFCHNCHSPAPGGGGHPAGWNDPGSHGVAAKAAPGASTGFGTCQVCHGAGQDFAGGSSGVSCTNNPDAACHGSTVASPHPSQWRSEDTYTHTNTAAGNASACAFCHTAGANSPITAPPAPAPGTAVSCRNNTLCHD
jgi:hypothetical protein